MAFDMFLQLDKIPGESQDAKMKNMITPKSFNWIAEQPGLINSGTTGAGAGKVNLNAIELKLALDSSYPKLLTAITSGTHIQTATLYLRKAGGDAKVSQSPYFIFTMNTVFITKLTVSGDDDDDIPEVDLTLMFKAMAVQYSQQKNDGTMAVAGVASWDQMKNSLSDIPIPTV